jgi:hypothetical protein
MFLKTEAAAVSTAGDLAGRRIALSQAAAAVLGVEGTAVPDIQLLLRVSLFCFCFCFLHLAACSCSLSAAATHHCVSNGRANQVLLLLLLLLLHRNLIVHTPSVHICHMLSSVVSVTAAAAAAAALLES